MKVLSILLFVFLAAATSLHAQAIEGLKLNKPTTTKPTNTLSFSLPANRLRELHESKGQKVAFKVPSIVVNGDSLKTEHIHIRGTSSSLLRRKSLNIKLKKKASFHSEEDTFSLKKFYAVSMNMDKNYIRNKISFKVLRYMGLNILPSSYTNLVINNQSEGLYMIFYPPDDYALNRLDASAVLRRVHNSTIDNLEFKGISSQDAAELRKKFQSIYGEIIHRHKGEELYQKLGEVLDLNGYFTWLAFNHLFQNGDYSDELYLTWNKTVNKFELIPWDFDDLLHTQPHEGYDARNQILHDKLIFSSEDALDVKIAEDDFLYMKYLQVYKQLLEKLTPSTFSGMLNSVYQEVYPYYLQPDVIAQSQYDTGGVTDLGKLEEDMKSIAQYINSKVVIHKEKIDGLLKGYEGVK